ncbi:MAG TPA: respiratory nitrate reductase subunit gamma [Candidatus Kapabacteria bacterium]|nr:respiratory nitrate reductase subunit gamma [Candidatus Kapabacteria bacterium]
MIMLNKILFGLYPYIAVTVCLVGCWIRFDREQYSWKTGSSQLLRGKNFRIASNLFHVGIIFILMGHIVGLLTPEAIYHHVITTQAKQILAMVSGGFFGILCLVGLLMLIQRRMTDPRIRNTGNTSDIALLLLLLAQLVLGLSTIVASTQHLDGSVMVMLANWAQSIVLLQPQQAADAIAPVRVVYKLHVLLGMTLILIVPFTRLVHVISAPVWYLGRRYQIVRQKAAQG